jgi:hypothetical protein
VKALIQKLACNVTFTRFAYNAGMPAAMLALIQSKPQVPVVWNGMVYKYNCFLDSVAAGGPGFPGDGMFSFSLHSFLPASQLPSCGMLTRR